MKDSLHTILVKPVVTEKSIRNQENSKYTFIVPKNTNKIEVKSAIESLYGVKVTNINKIKVLPKTRMIKRGKLATKRKHSIKMVVSLKKGAHLDITKTKNP